MNISALTATEVSLIIAFVVIVIVGMSAVLFRRKRQSEKLRTKFGDAEYSRVVHEGANRRSAEAGLVERTNRVESFHVRPISAADRARFLESWRGIQSRFVDGPAGAVSEADQLLGDVMSTRGYPVTDFDQRAADISVDHPVVLENYRTAHEIALRQAKGQANTEDLRQAMVHYRTLFDELVSEPKVMKAAS